MSGRPSKVMVLGSYAPSLVNFRGALLKALQSRGYHVVACAPMCEETAARLRQMNVEFIPLNLNRTGTDPFADIRYLLALSLLFRRIRPQALIAYTAKPVVWGSIAAKLAGVRRINAIITGLGSAMLPGHPPSNRTGGLLRKLYRVALSLCDRVAFQNPDDQREFIASQLVSDGKTFRVNGSGVPLEHFTPAPLPDAPSFLLIARLLADKGVREYAAAAGNLKARFPHARFRLAGWFDTNPTALAPEEVERWEKAGWIEFVGRLDDVRPEIASARVYVLPSYREGTPRTVLEAMSMGRAIITTDAPGCRETVQHEWNGLLVNPRDVPALTSAMERLILDPSMTENMGARSRAMAIQRFDANAVATELITGFNL